MRNRASYEWAGKRCRTRSVLAAVLSVLLAVGYLPAASGAEAGGSETEGVRYFGNGGQLFRLEYRDALRSGAAVLRGGGEFSVRVSRALFPSEAGESEWREQGFVFGEGRASGSIVDLGAAPSGALRRAGKETRRPSRWEEVVNWSVTSTPLTVTSTFRVGPDWMSLTLPRELLETGDAGLPEGLAVTVEANGIAARVEGADLQELGSRSACAGRRASLRESRALREMAESFVDLPRFMNQVRGYLEMERQARVGQVLGLVPDEEDPASSPCSTYCLSCAGSLLAGAGAYIALVAACGGSLVSGGTTIVLCVAAFLGVQSSHLLVFGSCARCVDCATEPSCPCENEPLCECG